MSAKVIPLISLADIFRYKGLIIGSPTYSNQIFPEVESLLSKILVRELKGRYLGYFGSFTWAGAAVKRMAEFAEKSKFELVGDPVEMETGHEGDHISTVWRTWHVLWPAVLKRQSISYP